LAEIAEALFTTSTALDSLQGIPAPLLAWYAKHARSMPWRDDPRPYPVWISEIMLQQTRVDAVRAPFMRFLAQLPDATALAGAPEERLLKLWEGLGYYSRARNLKKAAMQVCAEHNGELPADYTLLLGLPGFGEYTAGAVASIAFGVPVPAVDGNVCRVFSRLLASAANVDILSVKRAYRALVAGLIPADTPGAFNQALMELGATVCLPNGQPLCQSCPLLSLCSASRQGTAGDLPVRKAKQKRRCERRAVLFVIAERRVLLFRRPPSGLLGGMWEPLNRTGAFSARETELLLRGWGGTLQTVKKLLPAVHIFSHIEWRMDAAVVFSAPFAAPDGAVWADLSDIQNIYAIPSAFRAWRGALAHCLGAPPQTDKFAPQM
jgi:A/G-specific DNA glycosylase